MIKQQCFVRALNRFGLRSLKIAGNSLVSSLSALAVLWCVNLMGADPIRLPIVSVAASADDGNVAANTLDGSLATRWSAQGDGQWILFDLGSRVTVASAKIAWHQGNQRISRFDVQTSADAANWTTVFSGASSGTTLALESYNVTDSAGRFVRIVGHGNSSSTWNSICEVEIYGTADTTTPPPPPPPSGATLLNVQAVAASSADGNNVPANTLDKKLTTRWTALGEGQWIRFDLGSQATLTSAKIAWYKGVQRICDFDIQTSADATSWATVFSGASSGSTIALEAYDVSDSAGRFVRIVGYGTSVSMWNSIAEVELYGVPGTGGSTPPPPPPVNSALPSGILNLTNWKLTLPVDTSHAGSPDEILQPELNSFQDAQYFHVDDTRIGVVFKAHCGGATTSGSGYPRSELREMVNNGSARASWSTTSGTHTMEITQAITHLPVVKPQIVVGQIHDASDDVIVFRLEGTKLFIDQNGDNGPVLTTSYRLGDVFTTKFVARNGGVECYYNGQYIYTYPVNTSGCYFKAGAYTQSNTSKGDAASAYGEVVIYSLSVKHE
jgi:hypothetical protein